MPPVTLSIIAKEVGYSKNTVSLALRGDRQIPEETRKRIQDVADRLGYKPNAVVSHLMAQLRANRSARFQAKLALINAHRDPNAFKSHPTIPAYIAGCERRAARLGYDFDRFWLHDPKLKAESFIRILRTRGIKGILLIGLMDTNRLPEHLAALWDAFPTVVTGVRTRNPALSFACVDHHNLTLLALEKALALGYKRPALVLDDKIDRLVERRFSAGLHVIQTDLLPHTPIPIFRAVDDTPANQTLFTQWYQQHQPDVIFTLYNVIIPWLDALGLKAPRDLGIIQLEWRATRPEIAGMNQHNDIVGEAAVDMVVSQIHNNELGTPAFPRATFIGASWVDGTSVREQTLPIPVTKIGPAKTVRAAKKK